MNLAHILAFGTLHDAIQAQPFLYLFAAFGSVLICSGLSGLQFSSIVSRTEFGLRGDTVLLVYRGKATVLQHPNETQILQ